jgi:hypothetical protein
MPKGQRKPISERVRELRHELQSLEAQLEAEDVKRHALIGRAVAEHAEHDPQFADTLRAVLDERIRGKTARVAVGLAPAPSRRGRKPKAPVPAEREAV